ncbi:MAG TPA: TonB-dependent receptor [Longimicrobiales bacterium]|nr:TonB-dependent receptor [Longimicrobiales bacterium]
MLFLVSLGVALDGSIAGLAAQARDVTGTVRDSISGETLPNAVVSVEGGTARTLTDRLGRFTILGLGDGAYTLEVEYLGYATARVEVASSRDEALVIYLAPRAIELAGVRVEATGDLAQANGPISQITISPREVSALPSLGEADVFRTLQLMPGVSGTNDATSGLYVRGGTPDENLVLLDGMTVYHVDHFFGVFSAFNADAIKDMRLFKGGFPAIYGGRTSSVIDMIGKAGDAQRFNVAGGVNLLSGHVLTEVPLGGRGAWLVSARRSYTDLIRTPLYNGIFNTLQGAEEEQPGPGGFGGGPPGGFGGNFAQQTIQPDFYFYDLNSKLTYAPSDEDVLALSVYSGQDELDESSVGQQLSGPNGQTVLTPDRVDRSSWGNHGVSGRWSRAWTSRTTSDFLTAYSEYFSRADAGVESSQIAQGFRENNRVTDLTVRLDNTWQAARASEIGFGAQLTRSSVEYAFDQLRGDSIGGALDVQGSGTLLAAYAQHHWLASRQFDVTVGLRTTSYDQTSRMYWEPRASADFRLDDRLRLKAAWGLYYQFVKRVENEDVLEGSRDFWLLAGERIDPSRAEHRIVGASYDTGEYLFDVEVYDKILDGVSQFSTRARQQPGQQVGDLFFTGAGNARGVEVLLQKQQGRLTGWLGYTLAKVEYELAGFNDGEAFPASHDQRHEINAVTSYQIGPWSLAATWVYGSGRPYTLPEAQYALQLLDGRTLYYVHVGEKNGHRLPAYHRLDVSATRRFTLGRAFYELNLSLFNAYARNNVWYRQFDLSQLPMVVTDVRTLGFTPSIGLRVGLR